MDHDEVEWLPVDSSSLTWAGKNGLLHKFRVCLAHPNDWHQHMYHSFIFNVQLDDDDGPAYLVTKGHCVGVFRTW